MGEVDVGTYGNNAQLLVLHISREVVLVACHLLFSMLTTFGLRTQLLNVDDVITVTVPAGGACKARDELIAVDDG